MRSYDILFCGCRHKELLSYNGVSYFLFENGKFSDISLLFQVTLYFVILALRIEALFSIKPSIAVIGWMQSYFQL